MYLLDTNIISEIRKIQQGKADMHLSAWVKQIPVNKMHISALTLLELEKGIMQIERKDEQQGVILRTWLEKRVKPTFKGRILPFDENTASVCASMHIPNPKPITDSLIAATAIQHGLILVTRNVKDFEHTNANLLNPFDFQAA